jgi:hypothetical protein
MKEDSYTYMLCAVGAILGAITGGLVRGAGIGAIFRRGGVHGGRVEVHGHLALPRVRDMERALRGTVLYTNYRFVNDFIFFPTTTFQLNNPILFRSFQLDVIWSLLTGRLVREKVREILRGLRIG